MGCMDRKKGDYKRSMLKEKIDKKVLFALLVSSMLLTAATQLVMAATEDNLVISFDPDGEIAIDIHNATYAFGSAVSETWTNTSASYFTLYNNGTVAMDTEIKTNETTDPPSDMSLNLSGVAPGQDEYAIKVVGLTIEQYLNSTYALYGEYDQSLNPDDSKQFGLCLFLGNLSANHSVQNTTIYFRGTQH